MFFRKSKNGQSANAQPAAGPAPIDVEKKPAAETAAAADPTPSITADARRPADLAAIRQAVSFAQIVGIMMRSERHARMTLADLEWLVLPAVATRQFSIAEATSKANGRRFPVAVALWASVSPEVDRRLSQGAAAPIRLSQGEWRSGEILWVVDTAGDPRVVSALLNGLKEKAWGGRVARTAGAASA